MNGWNHISVCKLSVVRIIIWIYNYLEIIIIHYLKLHNNLKYFKLDNCVQIINIRYEHLKPYNSMLISILRISTLNYNWFEIIIMLLFENFSHPHQLMVFHWSLSDSKSPQVSRTLLSIPGDLNSTVV